MNFRSGLILAGLATFFTIASVGAQQPKDDRFTALAQANINQAGSATDSTEAASAYQRALDLALEGIAADSMNSQAYFFAARAYMGLGRYVEADVAFSRTEELWPDYLEETMLHRENGWVEAYNQGIELLESDDELALDLFRKANVIFHDRPEAFLSIGSILAGMLEYEAAIDSYKEVVRTIDQPSTREREEETLANWARFRTMALINTGQLYLGTDRPEEAAEVYQAVLDAEPDNEQAKSSLAIALSAGGESDAALDMYEAILADTTSSEFDYYNAGVGFYQAEVWGKAVEAFREVIDRNVMHRDALQNMAQSMLLAEQYEELLPFSKRLLEMDPYNEFAFRFHARALVETGSTDEAVRLMEEMAELPFLMEQLRIRSMGSSGARIDGMIVNKTLDEGSSITLRFHFFNRAGIDLGTEDVDVATGGADVAAQFRLDFSGGEEIGGYSYEVIS